MEMDARLKAIEERLLVLERKKAPVSEPIGVLSGRDGYVWNMTPLSTQRFSSPNNTTSNDGHFYVIWNGLVVIHAAAVQLRVCLHRPYEQRPDEIIANSLVFGTVTQLQHLLDAFASCVHRVYPNDAHTGPVYFSSYPFELSDTRWIAEYQSQIASLHFRDMTFNELANSLKHYQPYVGSVAFSVTDYSWDIVDSRKVKLFKDVIVEAYKSLSAMLDKLRHNSFKTLSVHKHLQL